MTAIRSENLDRLYALKKYNIPSKIEVFIKNIFRKLINNDLFTDAAKDLNTSNHKNIVIIAATRTVKKS
tara:strand:- start:2032 stop:2238 length:207 start_codon:yes stop_codon:yes gene_type:complete